MKYFIVHSIGFQGIHRKEGLEAVQTLKNLRQPLQQADKDRRKSRNERMKTCLLSFWKSGTIVPAEKPRRYVYSDRLAA